MEKKLKSDLYLILYFELGTKFLKLEFITSKRRESVFILAIVCLILSLTLDFLVVVFKRHQGFSGYLVLDYELHGTISILPSILFILIEMVVYFCLVVASILVVSTLYVCSFSMKFWLKKIWYAYAFLCEQIITTQVNLLCRF